MTVPERTYGRRGGTGRAASGLAWLVVALAAACSESSHPDNSQDLGLNEAPAPAFPSGLEVPDGPLFSLNTDTAVYPFDIPGDPDHILEGVLADAEGRREIRYTHRVDGTFEVVAPPDFNLPPAGARNASGEVAVCFNRLTGANTTLTEGAMPDPTQGVQLACRVRDAADWGPVLVLGADFQAAWLSDVTVSEAGLFTLDYYRDDGWFIPTDNPLHGLYRQTLTAGELSEAVQLEAPGGF